MEEVVENVEPVEETVDVVENAPTISAESSWTEEKVNDLLSNQETIIELLNNLLSYFDIIASASSAVLSYSVIWVPLILVTGMLWWFFRQFIR